MNIIYFYLLITGVLGSAIAWNDLAAASKGDSKRSR